MCFFYFINANLGQQTFSQVNKFIHELHWLAVWLIQWNFPNVSLMPTALLAKTLKFMIFKIFAHDSLWRIIFFFEGYSGVWKYLTLKCNRPYLSLYLLFVWKIISVEFKLCLHNRFDIRYRWILENKKHS